MQVAALVVLALGLAALAAGSGGGADDGGGGSSETALTVVFREDGERPDTEQTWSLACDPPGGSHPDPEQACETLARVGAAAFAPPPADRACAEIYGGAQRAVVTGTVDGVGVDATFQRRNGCEIEDWDTLLGLLPPGGVS
jgi:hypothetical protein